MKAIKLTNFLPALLSYLFGCITYYVFLCFNGVVLAHSSKIEVFILRTLFKLIPSGDSNAKRLIFNIVSYVEIALVSFIVLFIIIYFVTNYIGKGAITNSLAATLGAIITDLYYFKTMPFGSSYFLSENYEVDFLNLTIWFACTIAAIKMSYLVRVIRKNHDVQPSAQTMTRR